jgi:glucokinase
MTTPGQDRGTPVVLGLDFGGTKIAAAVCDLSGRRLGTTTVASGRDLGAHESFRRGVATGRELLDNEVPGSSLVAVGACTFGIPFDDRVELAPTIPGWSSLAFGRLLREAFPGVRLSVATDVKAAAAAEARWGSLVGCDPGLYVNLGTGLAAALVVGGQVVGGRHGAAGEIAYNLRRPTDVGRALAERIPLEDRVSGLALSRQATRATGRPMRAADVFDTHGADPVTETVLEEFVAELCFHVVNLAIALDPERVAVGGGMVRSWDVLGAALEHALAAAVPYPPELVVAAFPHDAALLGALALGVEAATGFRTSADLQEPREQVSGELDSGELSRVSAVRDGRGPNGRSSDRVSPQVGSTGEGQSR